MVLIMLSELIIMIKMMMISFCLIAEKTKENKRKELPKLRFKY